MNAGGLAITGLGLRTVLGNDVRSTWDAILAGRRVLDHTQSDIALGPYGSRVAAIAADVAGQAVRDAGWHAGTLADPRTGLVIATSKGEVESWIAARSLRNFNATFDHATDQSLGKTCPAGGLGPGWGIGRLAGVVGSHLRMGPGPAITVSAACASGLHALGRACLMVRFGQVDRVLVVAAEASVHPVFVESFRRLGVLPPAGHGCRPFDKSRAGFVMTEAAAAVCVERVDASRQASSPHRQPYAYVDRFAIAGDASHITSSDPTGCTLRRMLDNVIDDRPVDFVHAHGTGTVVNDPVELAAIDETVGRFRNSNFKNATADAPVPVFSHKAHLGHTLGAAGLVAVALNCEIHRSGVIPGNIATCEPLPAINCEVPIDARSQTVGRSLSLAAGFGGAMGSVTLTSTSPSSVRPAIESGDIEKVFR